MTTEFKESVLFGFAILILSAIIIFFMWGVHEAGKRVGYCDGMKMHYDSGYCYSMVGKVKVP